MLDGSGTNGILSSSAAAVASGFRSAAPTNAATSIAAARKTAARPNAPSFARPELGISALPAHDLALLSSALAICDDQRRQPRPPA